MTVDEFPKWKYHATKPALIVPDKAAEEALGEDWYDHPDDAATASVKPDDLADLQRMPKRKRI
jgi:hypothetical protein